MDKQQGEKTVVLGAVPTGAAEEFSRSRELDPPINIGEDAIPKFEKRELYSFQAEFTKREEDIIIHFYLPPRANLAGEGRQKWMEWWLKVFPSKFEPAVRDYFEADYPRLVAKYTEEATSWWFKAQGFGHILDLGAYLDGLFAKLDADLRESN